MVKVFGLKKPGNFLEYIIVMQVSTPFSWKWEKGLDKINKILREIHPLHFAKFLNLFNRL